MCAATSQAELAIPNINICFGWRFDRSLLIFKKYRLPVTTSMAGKDDKEAKRSASRIESFNWLVINQLPVSKPRTPAQPKRSTQMILRAAGIKIAEETADNCAKWNKESFRYQAAHQARATPKMISKLLDALLKNFFEIITIYYYKLIYCENYAKKY